MKVTIAAPFDSKGRYGGGISSIANAILKEQSVWEKNRIEPIMFETCRIQRSNNSQAKCTIKNIKNFFAIKKEIIKELSFSESKCLYYHSSVGIALLKDLLVIRRVKKKLNLPVILHIHFADYDKIIGKKWLKGAIMYLINRHVDQIVFLSKKTMQEFVDNGVDAERSSVIYNFTTFDFKQDEIEKSLIESSSGMNMLFMGSIDHRKGIFDTLNCMKEIEGDYYLHVCGGFVSRREEKLFHRYSEELNGKVVFHSYVNGIEKERIFKECDVLVLPSYAEGLPVVILEALSAGCCIISSNVGAIPEIIGEDNGIIVECGNEKQLLNALQYYVGAEKKIINKQKLNNYNYSKKFTKEKFIIDMCEICRKAVK